MKEKGYVDVLDATTPSADNMTDEDIEHLYSELEKKRKEWSAAEEDRAADHVFKLSFMTDKMAPDTGRAFGFAKGESKMKEAVEWCKQSNLPTLASFDSELYGEEEATTFAKAWCSRMNYLFAMWLAQANPTYKFTMADINGWVKTDDVSKAIEAMTPKQVRYPSDRFTRLPKGTK